MRGKVKTIKNRCIKGLGFFAIVLFVMSLFGGEIVAKAASEPYMKGTLIDDSYAIGDTFKLSGTVKGNGNIIEKIHVHYYNEDNNKDCGVFGTVYPDTKSYSLSKLGSFTVGEDCMLKAGATYVVKLWVRTDDGNSMLLEQVEVTIEKESKPYLNGTLLSESAYTMGDTFKLSGTVKGDGDYIEKIHIHYYNETNQNDCGVLGTVYPDAKSYSLSKLGSFIVGEDCMKKAGATYVVKIHAKNEDGKSYLLDTYRVTVKSATTGSYRENATTVLSQIKNGTSPYINVYEQAWQKVWTWYFQNGNQICTDWCVAFAHYVMNLSGIETQTYNYQSGYYAWNQSGVSNSMKYYNAYGAYYSSSNVYDYVETGDLIFMNDLGHVGVVYVDENTNIKYVIHGNIYQFGDTLENYGYKRSYVAVHELKHNNGINTVWGMSVNGYVSMDTFLTNNTAVDCSNTLPSQTYYVNGYALGGTRP